MDELQWMLGAIQPFLPVAIVVLALILLAVELYRLRKPPKTIFVDKVHIPMNRGLRRKHVSKLIADGVTHLFEELVYRKILTDAERDKYYARFARAGISDLARPSNKKKDPDRQTALKNRIRDRIADEFGKDAYAELAKRKKGDSKALDEIEELLTRIKSSKA